MVGLDIPIRVAETHYRGYPREEHMKENLFGIRRLRELFSECSNLVDIVDAAYISMTWSFNAII